jgi:hypothetical protein
MLPTHTHQHLILFDLLHSTTHHGAPTSCFTSVSTQQTSGNGGHGGSDQYKQQYQHHSQLEHGSVHSQGSGGNRNSMSRAALHSPQDPPISATGRRGGTDIEANSRSVSPESLQQQQAQQQQAQAQQAAEDEDSYNSGPVDLDDLTDLIKSQSGGGLLSSPSALPPPTQAQARTASDDFSYAHIPRDIQIDQLSVGSSGSVVSGNGGEGKNKPIPTLRPPPEKTSALKGGKKQQKEQRPEQAPPYVNNNNNEQETPPPILVNFPDTDRGNVNFPDSDNMSLGNTVASSTYGEDRQHVNQKTILDPYGDKGIYTGIILRSTGMPHGSGRMLYQEDKRTYDGEWRHGRWHGYGRATFANGDTYNGEYRFDQRHGRGRYEWNDGRVYDGMFREDKRHGRGIFTWPDGAIYEGDFRNGQREGHGAYRFSDGGRYEGSWKDGRYNGFGICNWVDGRCYKGEWLNGMAHGKGVETFADGSIRHDGQNPSLPPPRPWTRRRKRVAIPHL